MDTKFHGVGVAIVTPFNADQSIDFDGFGRIVRHISDGGVRYIVLQGTTGESPTVSKQEKANSYCNTLKKITQRICLLCLVWAGMLRPM